MVSILQALSSDAGSTHRPPQHVEWDRRAEQGYKDRCYAYIVKLFSIIVNRHFVPNVSRYSFLSKRNSPARTNMQATEEALKNGAQMVRSQWRAGDSRCRSVG